MHRLKNILFFLKLWIFTASNRMAPPPGHKPARKSSIVALCPDQRKTWLLAKALIVFWFRFFRKSERDSEAESRTLYSRGLWHESFTSLVSGLEGVSLKRVTRRDRISKSAFKIQKREKKRKRKPWWGRTLTKARDHFLRYWWLSRTMNSPCLTTFLWQNTFTREDDCSWEVSPSHPCLEEPTLSATQQQIILRIVVGIRG